MNYEDDINIDEQGLDVEWIDHPRRMLRYCKVAAEAHRDMDLAKEELDVSRARLAQAIRADPEAHGVVAGSRGITEGAIEAAILTHDDYREASRKFIDAKYQSDVAASVVRAFDHRKNALENLVRLHGASYFAGPKVPRNLTEERQMRVADQNARVASKMSRRR